MDEDPQLWTLQKSAEIAALCEQMLGAADAGDERVRDLLTMFEPSARDELAKQSNS